MIYGQLITPTNETVLNHTHVLFEWTQIPEATHYEMQLSEELNFSEPVLEDDGSEDGTDNNWIGFCQYRKFFSLEKYETKNINLNTLNQQVLKKNSR